MSTPNPLLLPRASRSVALGLLLAGTAMQPVAAQRTARPNQIKIEPRKQHSDIAKLQKPLLPAEQRRVLKREEVIKLAAGRVSQGGGLISRSTILSAGQYWTIVPKNAVLNVPALYAKRVNGPRSGKLIAWQEFFGQNRSWIKALPVTLQQADGTNPFSKEYLESLQKAGQVVVAVCHGGPISVLKPKEPAVAQAVPVEEAPAEAKTLRSPLRLPNVRPRTSGYPRRR